ncbi:MAG: GDP-mannose 4,6-dehydratase [Nanoarchaeota archaeon]|nr:GDP-mannose 4,6-dehydratase [Nanoarchaeota archaeon]
MKIMIFGGAGFVASHLVDYCLKQGDEVIITCRWNEDLSRMKHFEDKVKIEYVEATDITSIIRAINKHRPEVLSWLIAQSWVPYSFDNPIYTIETNTIGTLNLLEAVRIIQDIDSKNNSQYIRMGFDGQDIRYDPLIHVCSSSEYYGKVERENLPITENHPANPGNPYGVGKVGADLISQIYAKYYDMNILITRMFTHCGIRRSMMSAENFYAKSIAELEINGGDTIQVSNVTGMNSIRTWADVRDAVKNYHNLFKKNKTGVFNIAGESVKSIQEVLDYLISISKLDKDKIRFVENPKFFRKIDVDKQIVDITKFKESVNWENQITFEELMQSLLDYWREKIKNENTTKNR